MPSKFQMYRQMAEEAAKQITGSYQGWTSFLTTAARLYKYPYNEQVMIHAQRPDATACAEYDFWNDKMGRYVRRNSRGIAIIDTRGENPKLRYVFDVSDTGSTERARPVWLWQLKEENADRVSAMLQQNYDVDGKRPLPEQFEQAATQLIREYWNDNSRDIFGIVADSFLEEYDNYNIEVAFRNAAVVSTTYALMSRCGLSPENYFEHEDFLSIFDFNTPAAATVLGTAVSRMSGQILRQIEATIRSFEREQSRPEMTAERMEQNDRTDLHEERRLPDSQHQPQRDTGAEAPREVRTDAENLSSGKPPRTMGEPDPDREAVPTSEGDRRDSEPEAGADDARADEAQRRDGGTESRRSDDLGGDDEQPESTGGGNDTERADFQLTPFGRVYAQGEQLTLFPSEDDQIAYLNETESVVNAPSVFSMSIPEEDIDHILRLDGNADNARMRIATEFSKGKSDEEIADFLKNTFHGGNGIVTAGGRYSVWYAENGIHIATGDSARYLNSAKIVPWVEAAERIRSLLENGNYATNVELAEMRGHEVKTAAEHLWYMHQDMADSIRDRYFDEAMWKGGFPDSTARIGSMLTDDSMREVIVNETAQFAEAYAQDKSLMRFRLYLPERILHELTELGLPRHEYRSDMAEIPAVKHFITEDEIAASLTRRSMEYSKSRIYGYFLEKHTVQEQAKFLKDDYGTGGGSHAVSRASHSGENYSGKGLVLKKQDCPEIQMKWADVAKRVSELIRKDRYLTAEEKEQFAQLQEKYAAVGGLPTPRPGYGYPPPEDVIRNTATNDYNAVKEAHPDDIVLYQVGDFFEFYGEDAKTAAALLDINLTSKVIPNVGRVDMCGIPAHSLEQYVEKLRESHDVTISAVYRDTNERKVYTMRSVSHEAERVVDAPETELVADGTQPLEAVAEPPQEAPAFIRRTEMTQAEIDESLQMWNGNIESKRAVVRYMEDHARERETAAWLAGEFGVSDPSKPLHFTITGTDIDHEMSWAKIQRRIAQLIKEDRFFTEQEYDRLDDIDPAEVREALENAQGHADEMLAQAERIANESSVPAYERFEMRMYSSPGEEDKYAVWDNNANDFFWDDDNLIHAYDTESEYLEYLADVKRRVSDKESAEWLYVERSKLSDLESSAEERSTMAARDRFSIRLHPNEGGITGIWDAALDRFYEEGNQVLRFAEQDNAIDYLANIQRTHGMELSETIFTTPTGKPYRIGDGISSLETEHKEATIIIEDVTEDDIWYTLPSVPDQDAVSINRNSFERYLDTGFFAVVDQEQLIKEIEAERLSDEQFARENLFPDDTTFTIGNQTYLVDRVNYNTGMVNYQNISVVPTPGEEIFQVAPIAAIRAYMEAEQSPEQLLERAKALIADYCRKEFGTEGDFDDLTNIGLAFTTIEDDDIPIQASVDLVNFRLERYLGHQENHVVDVRQYDSLEQLIENELRRLDFNDLTEINDEAIAEYRAKEDAVDVAPPQDFPYAVGDTVYLEDGKPFIIEQIGTFEIQLRDSSLLYPISRAESRENFARLMERYPQERYTIEPIGVYPGEKTGLPYDIQIQTLRTNDPEPPVENFRITDENLGIGGAKAKFRMNMDAINLLKELEFEGRQATSEEQEVLSKYVGWGGLADAFDDTKPNWASEFQELYAALTPEEYAAARSSTLNAHYTSPTVIRAIYETVENMGFQTGNILEPAMGVGNFFGCLPESMQSSKLYGIELDSITGRIAKQLYPKADITVAGFETTDRKDFYDLAIGNVPFGQYQVNDRAYNKLGFSIHDYFFAKSLDQVRPGGVVAFVTSRYTMDKQSPEVRKYIAQRAELLGAIRLPNNAFKANAGTEVVSDIIFLQKRDRPIEIEPEWVHLGTNDDGFAINSYFIENPEMVLGRQTSESTQYGKQDFTVEPYEDLDLGVQLRYAIQNIRGTYTEAELPDLGENEAITESIPADPNVKNYSYTVVDGEVYYRQNSVMTKPDLNATAKERVKGLVELRDCVQKLIGQQMDGYISDEAIRETQAELNTLYDKYTEKYGLINSRANSLAFADDSSYYLLCSLEVLDEENNLKRKADMFTKRTIKAHEVVTSVDTASEALALSISEKARVDMEYMTELTGKDEQTLVSELRGVIFQNPQYGREPREQKYLTADEYLSGNVREKLRLAQSAQNSFEGDFSANVEALKAAQPKDLDASEIEVRLGSTWIDPDYIREFMWETFETPFYLRRSIDVNYSAFTAEWNITGKSQVGYSNINAYMTYGTERANAYKILEDTLNLRDVRIYDTKYDADGKERRVLNSKETTLAQQKQQAIKEAFREWIWKDPDRRHTLVTRYNELFNSTRPREYDGSHITFSGMNPEIKLREHQLNAVAHVLYGGNTLLAHEVGAGKTFEMVAAAMESKRLGLCQKSLFVVPNHLTEQWASEFLRLYPSANILVATKKDFETRNRKKFCGRIATGDYDAVIIGHSQFERIPVSQERQERLLQEQIWEVEEGLSELKASRAERFTIKSLERTKKSLETRLKKLQDSSRKDDVVTFEQLGVDRLYVDEAHNYKNLFLYTKMRNVAGLSTTDAQKSSDMLLKCRYIDEITDGKGIVFATGTPVSNSMTELYTMMRYLQHDTLRNKGLAHFDCWASTFGETQTAIELAPEGTGYRARTRFAKFFNLPELMTLFKEAADIKTADQLNLPTPTPVYHNEVAQPTAIQKEMVQELSERAAKVHAQLVDPSQDNMLKITSDGRKLGLDQRVINPDLPDDPTSKVNMCVDNITRIYEDGQADRLTQLVFCDLSTPKSTGTQKAAKAAGGNLDVPELHALEAMLDKENEDNGASFTVYDDIRNKLVARGIPREEIAFIHEANTEARKKDLFAKVRSGQVRVLIGSTFKMGAGMNVQDRLIALHDLDCPWRPGDLEQRSGRIIRQGNMNPEVHIYRYVTESTFDAYLWQTVENKQKFISQIMTSKSPVRSCEDVDETALSYAEIKALCAGDERIKEKMDLDVDVARLKLMKANHQSQQYRLEDNLLKTFPEQIKQNEGFVTGFEADLKTLAEHPHPTDGFAGMEVKGDMLTDKDNAGAAILEAFKDAKGMEPVHIGHYRGFAMSLTVEDFGKDFVLTLKGQMTHRVTLGKDARGNLTRIDNVLNAMPDRMNAVQDRLANLHTQVETAKAELGKPFPQEEELRWKSARLAELNAELNIDDRTPIERMAEEPEIAKSRPSVLAKLKQAPPQESTPKRKSIEKEER